MLAEYALAGIDKPIDVSSYELTRARPARLQPALPTVEEIEAELSPGESCKPPGRRTKPSRKKATKAEAKGKKRARA